jgi:Cysteine-rich CPXCG
MSDSEAETSFIVSCPYCGETMEIYVEPEVMGTLVQDCEVCCQPRQVRVGYEQGAHYVDVSRGDGSE